MRFRAEILLNGKTATGIRVPPEIVDGLGGGRKPAVLVRLGDFTYRSTIATMGGDFMLPVSAENREAAGVSAGDKVDVEVELDTKPREVDVPADLATALGAEPEAKAFFDGLSYSNQRWHVLSVEGAKTQETRQRRVEKSVGMLRERRAR
jgi:hypothetical protein